jgi:hypothetical protein
LWHYPVGVRILLIPGTWRLRSLRSLNPRLISRHAFGVRGNGQPAMAVL